MKDKGIYYALLLIIAVGLTITTCTNYYVKNASKAGTARNAATAYEGAPEDEALLGEMPNDSEPVGQGKLAMGQEPVGQGRLAMGQGDKSASLLAGGMAKDAPGQEAAGSSGEGSPMPGQEGSGQAGKFFERQGAVSGGQEEGNGSNVEIILRDGARTGEAGQAGAADMGAGPISPLESASPQADGPANVQGKALADEAAKAAYYRNRLSDLEAQIQKNRENQGNSNSASSAKNLASNELKLWDNELNAIYDEILERLDEKQAKSLAAEQREWMKERDRTAAEASQALAGASLESVEYTASQAESTRLRAYELVNAYEYLLVD